MFRRLFSPRYETASLFPDGMDRHTHILWGVDDGASCLEESLAIIRRLKGIKREGIQQKPDTLSAPVRTLTPKDMMTNRLKENIQLILKNRQKDTQ